MTRTCANNALLCPPLKLHASKKAQHSNNKREINDNTESVSTESSYICTKCGDGFHEKYNRP